MRRRPSRIRRRLKELQTAARQRLVDAAQQYTLRLTNAGVAAGVPASSDPLLTGDPNGQKIVMTGHQPVIFHSGLTFKYHVTEDFADDQSAIGIAVVIDTNMGDVDRYPFPQKLDEGGGLRLTQASMTSRAENEPNASRRVDEAETPDGFSPTLNSTPGLFARVQSEYGTLVLKGDVTPAEANLIVRWSHGIGAKLLELPLSAISSFPEVLALVADIINRADQFCSVHNETLGKFREDHRIRNSANPFPDLNVKPNRFELPLWTIGGPASDPTPLFVETGGNRTRLLADKETVHEFTGTLTGEHLESLLLHGVQLIPRGALITSLLRLLFADLFVHGVGGGRYDKFTDEFVPAWWDVKPAPFVVASASTYLFAQRRARLLELEALQRNLRDLMFNPQRHFGTGRFSPELEEQLIRLSEEKTRAVEQLKTAKKEGRSAKDIGHQIQTITDSMKNLVAAEFEPQLKPLTSMDEDTRAAIECRTYPWFLF